jgi:membrane-associated protein
MFDRFVHLVSDASGWAYLAIWLLAYLDVLVPLVPSETAVITAGVVAASGSLELALIVVVAAAGAFLGDNTSYLVGRRFGTRALTRFGGEAARRRSEWARRQLADRGAELILVGRFIPGGRTAVTLSAGTVRYPWRRFAIFDAVASLVWALYASLLGYFGGRAFEHAPWKGLGLALGLAFALGGAIELVRWAVRRRRA